MSMKEYDSNEVDVIVAGIPIASGRGKGEFLKIAANTNAFTHVKGVDGQGSRARTHDDSALATITVMQTSDSNALLSALYTLDTNAPGGAGVGPFLVKDKQGTSIFAAAECWIEKIPEVTYAGEVGERQWPIRIDSLKPFVGGN
jgi:hypothetical protein